MKEKIFPRLETKRLLMDKLELHHASDYLAIRSNENVMKSTAMRVISAKDIQRIERYIQQQQNKFKRGNYLFWGMFLRETQNLIGAIFTEDINKHNLWVEIGYFLTQSAWGNGYMTEAVGEVVRYCFEDWGMNRIQAWTFDDNVASQKVLIKNSFQHEGTFRDFIRHPDSSLRTIRYYSLLKRDILT